MKLEKFIENKKQEMKQWENKLKILECIDFDVYVNSVDDYITRDFSLANRVEIKNTIPVVLDFHYETDNEYWRLDLWHDFHTEHGDLSVSCRFIGVSSENEEIPGGWYHYQKMANPQKYDELQGIIRQDIGEVCKYYSDLGVKKELVDELKQKLEELYNTPFEEKEYAKRYREEMQQQMKDAGIIEEDENE